MTRRQSVRQQPIGWSHRGFLFMCVALIALSGHSSRSQGSPPGLNYFKNFFVTGNYVTASVDFGSQSGGGGFVTGVINFDDPSELVPPDADVVGAFLYWQVIKGSQPLPTTGLMFRDNDISAIAKEVASAPLDQTFSPCWSGGGQGANIMKTFRADVRRFLPVGNPVGKILVNDADLIANSLPLHEVVLPDNGTGNQTPQTAGASLVVIYRLPTESLKSVVLYDGLQVKPTAATPTTTSQTIRGFFQASATPAAKLTLLVGSGAKNATERVLFGTGATNDPIIATNPFFTRESNSPGSDRAWDGPTWNVSAQMPSSPVPTDYGEEVTVQLTHTEATPYDCLATSAIVFSTTVADTDFDGLLNVWETGDVSDLVPTHAPLLDPTGQPLPNLYAMGADPDVQDIFIELGFMNSPTGYDTPLGHVDLHTHVPSQAVFDGVAQVFADGAPRKNPADVTQIKSGAIKIHFDVGSRYQGSPNVIKFKHADGTTACSAITDPACLARGGEEIPETEGCPATGPDSTCAFPGFRGVVGWKVGFRFLRDQPLLPLNPDSSTPSEAQCEAAGPACVRRFDENRRHMFRYALLGHALGVPRPDDPTTAFHEDKFPRSIAGVSDGGAGGGDFAITLGMWDNFTGTEFVQKSVFVHEFGHGAGLRHGGMAPAILDPSANCKPNYESVMNYMYVIRGLVAPVPKIDFSRQVLKIVQPGSPSQPLINLDEGSVTETALRAGTTTSASTAALYPPRWYAPLAGSYLDGLVGTTASTRHCNGLPLQPNPFLPDGVTPNPDYNPADAIPMVRLDGTYPIGAIDWNANGTFSPGDGRPQPFSQDINFNGDGSGTTLDPAADGVFKGWNDWEHLDLRQTGSRRVSLGLSLEITKDDLAATDPYVDGAYVDGAYVDGAYVDGAYVDGAYVDGAYVDGAYVDGAYVDGAYVDGAYVDGAYGGDFPIDEDAAKSQGPAANSLSYTRTNQSITLRWRPPHAGGPVASYHVWKAQDAISPTNLPTDITLNGLPPGTVCNPTTGLCSFVDSAIQNRRTYQYFIVTWFQSGQKTRSEILTALP